MTDSITVTPDPAENNGQQSFNATTGNTGSGFLTGVQPAPYTQRVTTAGEPQTLTPEQIAALSAQAVQPQLQQQGETLSEMQQRMAAMQTEIDAARTAREAAEAAAAEAEQARLAAEQQAAEQEMSATELVGRVREEMQQQFEQMRAAADASNAILEQERQYNALAEYKAQRLADPEIAAAVMPHLHQYIVGNSEQEIEEAIARAAQTSNSIVGEFQSYQQQYRQQAPGVSTAVPTTGPMEAQQSERQMSAQEIAALPPAEYARLRPQLLRAAGNAYRANQGR